jgi:hypothetical protein
MYNSDGVFHPKKNVMSKIAPDADRQLPVGAEIFLDHVGHFVRDAPAAERALARAGFAPTPVSVQVNPGPDGEARPSGTGNITAMLARGYVEVLFKTADTALGREHDASLARYPGVHLAAFAVVDASAALARLAAGGLRVAPLVEMQRPVATPAGPDVAAFTIARVAPGEMAEGRMQILAHRTEHMVWQTRWLSHENGALALLDLVIAAEDVAETAARFSGFLDRPAAENAAGRAVVLDRGRVQIVTAESFARLVPGVGVPALPFVGAYGVRVRALDTLQEALRRGGVAFAQRDAAVLAPFPEELGLGAWCFVADAADLPWRRAAP